MYLQSIHLNCKHNNANNDLFGYEKVFKFSLTQALCKIYMINRYAGGVRGVLIRIIANAVTFYSNF